MTRTNPGPPRDIPEDETPSPGPGTLAMITLTAVAEVIPARPAEDEEGEQ